MEKYGVYKPLEGWLLHNKYYLYTQHICCTYSKKQISMPDNLVG